MKTLLYAFLAFAAITVEAQSANTVGDAIEGQPINLGYEHTVNYPTRIYNNGAQVKEFTISEITTTGTTNGVVSFKITLTGLFKGVYSFTAKSVATLPDLSVVLSDPSNICTITVRPAAPGQLRKLP
jgi:hypothetical protein